MGIGYLKLSLNKVLATAVCLLGLLEGSIPQHSGSFNSFYTKKTKGQAVRQ